VVESWIFFIDDDYFFGVVDKQRSGLEADTKGLMETGDVPNGSQSDSKLRMITLQEV